jgi:hypothetical protein
MPLKPHWNEAWKIEAMIRLVLEKPNVQWDEHELGKIFDFPKAYIRSRLAGRKEIDQEALWNGHGGNRGYVTAALSYRTVAA